MKTRKVEQKGDQKENYNKKQNRKTTKKHNVKSEHKIRKVKLSKEINIFHRIAKIFCVMAVLCCLLTLPAMAQAPEKKRIHS